MVDFKIPPIPMSKGGGALLLDHLRSGAQGGAHIAPKITYLLGYKLRVASNGTWEGTGVALAGALTQTLDLPTVFPTRPFPTNVWVHRVYYQVNTPLAGGAIATATLDLGDAGNDDEWVDLADIFTGAPSTPQWDDTDADAVFAAAKMPVFEAAYVPRATITTTVGNISVATAGDIDIVYEISPKMPILPSPL